MADKMLIKASGKAPVITDDDERIIEGWASTDNLDRYNEITDPQAFKKSLKTYMKNPVLFFGHESWGLPIGKILEAKIKENGLWIQAKISEGADAVWGLIKEEILRTFSFAYKLLKYDKDEKTGVLTIRDLELYEISVVSIPANPEAMIELAKSKGIDIPNFQSSMHKEENMEKEFQDQIDILTKKIDAIPKAMTKDEAAKALSDIHKEIEELKKKGDATPEKLKELQAKSSADLMEAIKTLEKNIEQNWVTPPKMPHDTSSVDQAKRLGNLKDMERPERFKQVLISNDAEKAAATIGMSDQKHLVKDLQKASDDLLIVGAYLKMVDGGADGTHWKRDPSHLKTYREYKRLLDEFHKALDTETALEGAEWLPTMMSATLVEDMEIERTLGRRMPRFAQPTKSYVWPLKTSDAVAYIVDEATADSAANIFTLSTPGTSSITFTAKGMGAGVVTSDEEVEDSIIPIIPFIRTSLAKAQADGEENALINGDDATTHQDTDVAALGATDIRKIFDGLRLDALAYAGYDMAGTLTYAKMISTLKAAGKWGKIAGQGFWLVSIDAYYFMLGLTEFTGYNVFSNMAVAGTGALPRAIGHEIVPSEYMRNDLGPAGVNAVSDNIHTAIMYVNPKAYMIGDRKINTIESDRLILTSQTVIVAKQRIDFKKLTISTATSAAIGYNITTAA